MPTVSIGTMDKRINSTKQTFSSAFSADCKLKEPCSMESPVFIVQGLSKSSFYNYCSYQGRYYWVDDIICKTNNIVEVHCHLDPLATYKDDIKSTFAYVQYADKSHWNKYIDDVRIQPEMEDTNLSTSDVVHIINGSETGSVVLRVYACGSTTGIYTVAITPNSFRNMLVDLNNELSAATQIHEVAAKIGGLGSWRDNIVSCVWVPFSPTSIGGSSGTINFDIASIPVSAEGCFCAEIVRQNMQGNWTLDWSFAYDHPYLKHSRWTSYQIVTPFGYADLPLDLIKNQSNIYCQSSVIKTTGDILVGIYETGYGSGHLLCSFAGNVSQDLMSTLGNGKNFGTSFGNTMKWGAQLGIGAATLGMSIGAGQLAMTQAAQSVTDVGYGGAGNGKLASAFDNFERTQSSVNMNNFNAGVGAIASCVPSAVSVSAPSGAVSCGINGLWITGVFGDCLLNRKVFVPKDKAGYANFCDMYGYPCNQYMNLSTISGYVKCSGAVVKANNASAASLASLNSMVNSGIFIE